MTPKSKLGLAPNKFFMAIPFMRYLPFFLVINPSVNTSTMIFVCCWKFLLIHYSPHRQLKEWIPKHKLESTSSDEDFSSNGNTPCKPFRWVRLFIIYILFVIIIRPLWNSALLVLNENLCANHFLQTNQRTTVNSGLQTLAFLSTTWICLLLQ